MRARIYQQAKTAMQSGRSNTEEWVLEFPRQNRSTPDQLMGWPSSGDTMQTIRIKFKTLDDAITYAETNEIDYIVVRPPAQKRVLKAYADNFAYRRRESWTH